MCVCETCHVQVKVLVLNRQRAELLHLLIHAYSFDRIFIVLRLTERGGKREREGGREGVGGKGGVDTGLFC